MVEMTPLAWDCSYRSYTNPRIWIGECQLQHIVIGTEATLIGAMSLREKFKGQLVQQCPQLLTITAEEYRKFMGHGVLPQS
jgi:hypothetical protein